MNRLMMACVVLGAFVGSAFAGDRVLEQEAVVDAPVAEVWEAWTTDEGIRSWMVPHGTVDLRVGGEYRTAYKAGVDLDGREAIVNEIIAFDPERMLAMRNTQAPSGFPSADKFQSTWSVVYFEPLGATRTRLVCKGFGYGEGPEWDQLYQYFEQGNAFLFNKLKAALEDGPDRDYSAQSVHGALAPFVGGCWRVRKEMDGGGVLRSVFVFKEMNGGEHYVANGWLGDDETMREHGLSVFGTNPATGTAWLWEWLEDGSMMSGPTWVEDGRVHMDLTLTSPNGDTRAMHGTYRFPDDDTCVWGMINPDGSTFIELTFERVGIEKLGEWVEAGMDDESSRFAKETRDEAIVVEREINAPASAVYAVWTTDDGFQRVFERETNLELRVGGAYEIYWDSENKIGSNGCRVLSFSPGEYVAFSWNAPPSIPEIRERRTVVTVSVEDLGDGRSLMRIKNDGYGVGGAWDEAYAYFENAWPNVADTIAAHFGGERTAEGG